MNWQSEIESRLARAGADPDPDIVLELAQHAAAAFQRARADGLDEQAAHARVAAMIDAWCADPAAVRRRPRRDVAIDPPAASSRGFVGFGADLRYGLRQLRRQPGYALTAILVSALGIGAATTIFSVAYGVLLRPLPWPAANRLVRVSETREGATRSFGAITTNATYLAWKDAPATIDQIAAYGTDNVAMGTGDDARRVPIVRTTAALFEVLGVRPQLGGVFAATDEVGPGKVVVLSHAFWKNNLGARTDIVGQSVNIEGAAYVVAGVMPEGFYFPEPMIAGWAPRSITPVTNPNNPQSRALSLVRGIARLRPGVTPEQASAEGTARSRGGPDLGKVGIAMFGTKGAVTVTATPYLAAITADVQPALVVLMGAVALLVIAGTANIAGMQLARALGRRRELAIRSALGAATSRLTRQLLTESFVVGMAGGIGGLALAWALNRVLPSVMPTDFPRLNDVTVDWRVALFAAGATLVVTLLVGLFPARVASRLSLVQALTEDGQAPVGQKLRSHAGRMRALVLAGQVAVAALLLVGASLLTRSFIALMSVDRGYDPQNLLTAELAMPDRLYSAERRAAFLDGLIERLRGVPGVRAAAVANGMPLAGYDSLVGFKRPPVPGQPNAPTDIQATIRAVSLDYFSALGIPIVQGRAFTMADRTTNARQLLVNETFARRYLIGNPVGQTLPVSFDPEKDETQTIIGVARDAQHGRATDPQQPQIFVLYRQRLDFPQPMVLVRTTSDPAALAPALERVVRELDHAVVPVSVMTMEAKLGASLSKPRLYALLLGGFAGFAVLVCGIGLFGVLANSVAERRREIGIRAALGAQPGDVVRLVVVQGLTLTVAGTVIGLGAAWLLSNQVGTMLYGITTHDAVSFALVPLALIGTAVVACVAPARKAAKVNPIIVLK